MNESIFLMRFCDTSLAKVKEVLSCIFPETEIRQKVDLRGDEDLTLENGKIQLHVHPTMGTYIDYLGSAEYFGSMEEMRAFLTILGQAFASRGIIYEFECYEETPEGEQVGDSYTMCHPDFDSFQKPDAGADES